jgi:Transposase DDE domain
MGVMVAYSRTLPSRPNKEIKKMNIGKVGAPFHYSNSYVTFLAFLKIGFKIPYRMVQGIVRGLSEYVRIVEEIHFTHIRRRMLTIRPSSFRHPKG